MSAYLAIMKCFFYTFNVVCLILGIGAIAFNVLGLQTAKVSTDEHAYFLVGLILATLVCLTTFFGCYAAFYELLGVNIVYGLLLVILLVIQSLQLRNFHPQNFYQHALQHAEDAWHQIETRPQMMAAIEGNYNCCALENASDYEDQHLVIPPSCYHHPNAGQLTDLHRIIGCRQALEYSYHLSWKREELYNWSLMITEIIAVVSAVIWVVMVYTQRRHQSMPRLSSFMQRLANHSSSRSFLVTP